MDDRLRELERLVLSGVAVSEEQITATWLRAGGRDPRYDPKTGDVVAGEGGGRYHARVFRILEVKFGPATRQLHTGDGTHHEGDECPRTVFLHPPRKEVHRSRVVTNPGQMLWVDYVFLASWRTWARKGAVLRVACPACQGTRRRGACSACGDSGCALSLDDPAAIVARSRFGVLGRCFGSTPDGRCEVEATRYLNGHGMCPEHAARYETRMADIQRAAEGA